MSERKNAFVVASSERMTRRDHVLRVAQARSVVKKRPHLAKAKASETSQGRSLQHTIISSDNIDEDAASPCLERRQATYSNPPTDFRHWSNRSYVSCVHATSSEKSRSLCIF